MRTRALVAHLLTESALLALAGGALGVIAAIAFLDGLLSLYPGTLPRAEAITLDWRALAFAAVVTGLTALLFGLLPALRASSSSPETVLHAQTRGIVGGRSRLMRAFVVAEVASSVMLVVGAGLLLRSYENIRGVDLGFDAEGVYTAAQLLPFSSYPITDTAAVPRLRAAHRESRRAAGRGIGGRDLEPADPCVPAGSTRSSSGPRRSRSPANRAGTPARCWSRRATLKRCGFQSVAAG